VKLPISAGSTASWIMFDGEWCVNIIITVSPRPATTETVQEQYICIALTIVSWDISILQQDNARLKHNRNIVQMHLPRDPNILKPKIASNRYTDFAVFRNSDIYHCRFREITVSFYRIRDIAVEFFSFGLSYRSYHCCRDMSGRRARDSSWTAQHIQYSVLF